MLTLDPVGLDHGIFTVMNDGDPICDLDLENYPALIEKHQHADYDALCDSIQLRVSDAANRLSQSETQWLDGLYGKDSWPNDMVQAFKDFNVFVRLRWLTIDDKQRFIRVIRQLNVIGGAP